MPNFGEGSTGFSFKLKIRYCRVSSMKELAAVLWGKILKEDVHHVEALLVFAGR